MDAAVKSRGIELLGESCPRGRKLRIKERALIQ